MYRFLNEHFMLIVLILVTIIPVLSIIALIVMWHSVSVSLSAPEPAVTRTEVGYLDLKLTNRSIFVSYDVCVRLMTENTFYGSVGGSILSLPLHAMDAYEKQLPVRYTMNGSYSYSIDAITVRDLLGFISLKKTVDARTEVNVYPESTGSADMNMSDMSLGMTESEETVKKGHDFSDVSDVREYIPGDKLMSIHWKLSAKKDDLMVKDRVSMSDQQMVIVVSLAGEPEQVDEVLTTAYGVVRAFVDDQIYVRLMWWSQARFGFEERQIMSQDDIREAFGDIYYETIYADSSIERTYMISIHPELKAYVNVCFDESKAAAVVVENA